MGNEFKSIDKTTRKQPLVQTIAYGCGESNLGKKVYGDSRKLIGVKAEDGLITFYNNFGKCKTITVDEFSSIYKFIVDNKDRIPNEKTEVKYTSDKEYRDAMSILNRFEKRWRVDKTVVEDEEVQRLNNHIHIGRYGDTNVYVRALYGILIIDFENVVYTITTEENILSNTIDDYIYLLGKLI